MLLTKAEAVSLEEAMKMEARNLVAKRRCMIDELLLLLLLLLFVYALKCRRWFVEGKARDMIHGLMMEDR